MTSGAGRSTALRRRLGVASDPPPGWGAARRALLDPLRRRVLRLLDRAGPPPGWSTRRLRAAILGGGALGAAAGFAVGWWWGGATSALVVGSIGMLGGAALAPWRLHVIARSRQRALAAALPDLLDLLAVTVAAGLALDAALLRVTSTVDGPAADELRRLRHELTLGVPRREALRSLAERSGLPQLALFASAVTQAESSGAPIAEVLRSQAATQRAHAALAAEERAARLPVALVVPLVLCVLPSLFVVVIGPAVVSVLAEGVLP